MTATWRPDRATIIDGLGTAAVTLLAVEAFSSSYGGVRFLIVAAVATVVALAVGHVLLVLRPPVLVGALASIVVYLVVGGVVALPERATGRVVPSGSTIRGAADGAVRGWRELLTTAPPVTGIGTLMVLPFLCAFFAALITFVLMRSTSRRSGSSLLSLLPIAAVLGIAILTGVREPSSLVLQGPVLTVVVVAWVGWRHGSRMDRLEGSPPAWHQGGRALAMLLVAAVAGWVVSPQLPFAAADDRVVWRETIKPPFDPRVHPSPLSGYRAYLAKASQREAVLFTMEAVPEDTLVRLATLDSYDGLVWRPGYDDESPSAADSGYFARVGSEVTPEFDGERVDITVTIGAYTGIWVPDVGEVVSLRFEGGPRDRELNEALRYNSSTDTAVVEVGLREGDRFVMTVVVPTAMAAVAGKQVEFTRDVPDAVVVQDVVAWTQKVPGLLGNDDPGRRLDAVSSFMREKGVYSDGDRARDQQPARAGHSAYRLAEFVDSKGGLVGNAEQYASTYALVARNVLDLPARVVMGFRTENRVGSTVTVTGDDVDAWVEVPIVGVGWVALRPTPDRTDTALKQQSTTPPKPDYDTQTPAPPPLIEPNFDIPATSKSGLADEIDEQDTAEEADDDVSSGGAAIEVSPWVVVTGVAIGGPIALFILFAVSVVGLKAWRRRRRKRKGAYDTRIANGWLEVVDGGIDMGRPVPPSATRREAAAAVGPATVWLARRADEAVFGPVELSDADVEMYWAELESTLKAMRSELRIGDRIRTALNVSTLRRRRTSGE